MDRRPIENWVNTPKQCVQIRARPSPDKLYPYQLNITDLLDAATAMLPSDAYALCLLIDHDLFETDNDLFVCGRAYGGRRVAVVLTARYNPLLDSVHGIDQDHAWPASHCQDLIESTCEEHGSHSNRHSKKRRITPAPNPNTKHINNASSKTNAPLHAAITAFTTLYNAKPKPNHHQHNQTLILFRTLRTTTHELGH
ncbi:uncharacterized protein BDV17DRAFT_269122 [Aspergillus undulatus]|uniref:uncharacterized protein n=1 Tax=Aspergillus undulatus TaxID=1810928 RepID=UPI003CCD2C2D